MKESEEGINMEKCINCNGQGGWDIAVQTSAENVMWVSGGDYMELGYKECYWCKGSGKISVERLEEMKKLKKKK